MKTIEFKNGCLYLLDQTSLPTEKKIITCSSCQETARAIKEMQVRGAPAIGVAAAYGLVLAANEYNGKDSKALIDVLEKAKEILGNTRPTAVNLFWALERMANIWHKNEHLLVTNMRTLLENEAHVIAEDDLARNKRLGLMGQELIPPKARILTHCNAGALATYGYGTALGVIRAAQENGKNIEVYADETRPLLQGARLTAWELMEDNIPVTVITDSTAGYLMQQRKIDLIIVGADRIAANGDTANKIGTYSLAVLAHHHQIPFYVAAPFSTVDISISTGQEIKIEERDHDEVRRWGNSQLAPENALVYNPAFDVTPNDLITAIITDYGIARRPYYESILRLKKSFEDKREERP